MSHPDPIATLKASMASNIELITWGEVSKMLGQIKLMRWASASSHPMFATPREMCFIVVAAVYQWTRSQSHKASSSRGVMA